jgi:hypothetical protein
MFFRVSWGSFVDPAFFSQRTPIGGFVDSSSWVLFSEGDRIGGFH